MSDERDDLDRALAAGLGGLAGDDDDADAVLATMQPRLRRAQTRHRAAIASVAVLSVLGIAGLGAAMTGSNGQRRVDVSAAPTSTTQESNVTSTTRPPRATTTTRPANRPTATTIPGVPTTGGNRGPGSGATLGGSSGSSGTIGGGPGPSTPAPTSPATAQPAKNYTQRVQGGTVTVRFANGALTLLSSKANDGYTAQVATQKPDDIEVRFSKGSGQDSRIRFRVENGQVTVETR